MLPEVHLMSHSRMSGSRWVTIILLFASLRYIYIFWVSFFCTSYISIQFSECVWGGSCLYSRITLNLSPLCSQLCEADALKNPNSYDFILGLTNGSPWQEFGGREKQYIREFIFLILFLCGCLSMAMPFEDMSPLKFAMCTSEFSNLALPSFLRV